MVKKGVKTCRYCEQEIVLNDSKYVFLGTYNRKKILEEAYYHFKCFVDWYNSKVTEKATETLKTASNVAGEVLKKFMKGSGGKEIVDMVEGEIPDMEKEVET